MAWNTSSYLRELPELVVIAFEMDVQLKQQYKCTANNNYIHILWLGMFIRDTRHVYYLLGKGGYVFGSVGLSVCLFVCGGDLGIVRWVNEQKNTVIVVAYPDRGEGNDPEPFFFFFFFFRGVGG